jgi:hypothetical protein
MIRVSAEPRDRREIMRKMNDPMIPFDGADQVRVTDPSGSRSLEAWVKRVGEDIVIAVGGGDRPHVGCVVLAVPSPKPGGSGHAPSVSLLTIPPHKEEPIARTIAVAVCRKAGFATVVTAGVHEDGIDSSGIETYLQLGEELAAEIAARLPARG